MRIPSYAMRGLVMLMTLSSLILASEAKLGESQRKLDPQDANKEHNSLQKNAKLDRHLKIKKTNKKLDEITFDLTVIITDDSDHFMRLLPDFLKMDFEDYFFDQYGEKIKATFIEDTTDRNLIEEEDPNSERELQSRYRRLRFLGMSSCTSSRGYGCGQHKRFRQSAWNRDRGRELKNNVLGEVLENFGADLTHIFTGIESIDAGI